MSKSKHVGGTLKKWKNIFIKIITYNDCSLQNVNIYYKSDLKGVLGAPFLFEHKLIYVLYIKII